MKNLFKAVGEKIKQAFGFKNRKFVKRDVLKQYMAAHSELDFLKRLDAGVVGRILGLIDHSKSQLRQDLFVLAELNFKENGFFVEFGATDGIGLSNTYLLEKEFGWSGILAEPARIWHQDIVRNRSAVIEYDCVWKESGQKLEFNEVSIPELSTLSKYSAKDEHSTARETGNTYLVNTITLAELLALHNAPRMIDYLSIDTEGSEYEILKVFDFDTWQFRVITVEHNFTEDREKIYDLLTANGYVRKFTDLSKFDDWYVLDQV